MFLAWPHKKKTPLLIVGSGAHLKVEHEVEERVQVIVWGPWHMHDKL